MKRSIIILVFAIIGFSLNAQVIPNWSFETWSNGADTTPDGWSDNGSNNTGFQPVTRTTSAFLGTYAVQMENMISGGDTTQGGIFTTRPHNKGGFGPAFPISARYNNLKGYYKYTPLNGDSAQVIVYITKTGYSDPEGYGYLLAWGQKEIGAAATYTPFSVGYESATNFQYMDTNTTGTTIPDSGYIAISAFKTLGTSSYNLKPLGNSILVVDALNFNTYLGIDEHMDITSNFNLYPNANNGVFDVTFNTSEKDFTTIKIYDLDGKEIMNLFSGTLDSGNHTFHYKLPELTNGNYLYIVATGKGYRTEKICIQK
jgi:hypothetical protein